MLPHFSPISSHSPMRVKKMERENKKGKKEEEKKKTKRRRSMRKK